MKMPTTPNLTEEERAFLHYNPNTEDLVLWVQGYALAYGEMVREACAKVCDDQYERDKPKQQSGCQDYQYSTGYHDATGDCASAIRGEEK